VTHTHTPTHILTHILTLTHSHTLTQMNQAVNAKCLLVERLQNKSCFQLLPQPLAGTLICAQGTCRHSHTHTFTPDRIHTHTHTHTHTLPNTRIHSRANTHTRTQMLISRLVFSLYPLLTHTHTHTHTFTCLLW